ncbi:peptidylprolyl isomerase [Aliiroseovarius sediminilitoris]|uniref:Peptidyl-prolyl cis-trans isomerase n=1 Tax=Aliiroseovarius sediminilitoris TaxID=1173584 RepID=A0A1I0Q0S0_9RHOB|nr:peptidylprolyl isomerase [Aliiroseovarius sediminilitoris]SEW20388.1 peptidylprolyl isomerase [Aliiroseovarius sediminilitoris]
MSEDYGKRDRTIFWIAFLAGVTMVVGYAIYTLWPREPAEVDLSALSDAPKLELSIAGQAQGTVVITLRPDLAPKHVERIAQLAREGAYDDVVFHRVIDGFMAQTGDVEFGRVDTNDASRAGMGGSRYPDLPAEFSEVPFVEGTVGMARSQNPNSANSQFFIMFAPGPFLDGKYTVVGQVTQGMDVVHAIKRGEGQNGAVTSQPDVITEARVVD